MLTKHGLRITFFFFRFDKTEIGFWLIHRLKFIHEPTMKTQKLV